MTVVWLTVDNERKSEVSNGVTENKNPSFLPICAETLGVMPKGIELT